VGGTSKAAEDSWKYLTSKKMDHMWKVFVEPSPVYFSQLQTSLRKSKVANATSVQAAVTPRDYLKTISPGSSGDPTPLVDLFCRTASSNNPKNMSSLLLRPSLKRHFCSLNPVHPLLKPLSPASNSPGGEGGEGSAEESSVWQVKVPAMSLSDLPLHRPESEGNSHSHSGGDANLVRLLILDTDDSMDFGVNESLANWHCIACVCMMQS
jgi:hypothetical protein